MHDPCRWRLYHLPCDPPQRSAWARRAIWYPGIYIEHAPPFENFNLFTLSNTDQGGFYITSDVVGFTVGTIHLMESNLFLPLVASPFADPPILATTYAIECAGGGAFVIKAVDADLLWTSVPTVDPTDPETGNATIQMLPADGESHQMFFLHAA